MAHYQNGYTRGLLKLKSEHTYIHTYIHTGFIGIWQPEAGLNKHTHIHKHEIVGLQIKHIWKNVTGIWNK